MLLEVVVGMLPDYACPWAGRRQVKGRERKDSVSGGGEGGGSGDAGSRSKISWSTWWHVLSFLLSSVSGLSLSAPTFLLSQSQQASPPQK